jgi:hypothetical protein
MTNDIQMSQPYERELSVLPSDFANLDEVADARGVSRAQYDGFRMQNASSGENSFCFPRFGAYAVSRFRPLVTELGR